MTHYFGVAEEVGLNNEEIGAAQTILMAVSAGKARARIREARISAKKEKKAPR